MKLFFQKKQSFDNYFAACTKQENSNSSTQFKLWKLKLWTDLGLFLSIINHLLNATVIVSVELAHGHRASGFRPLASKALRNESQADKDPGKKMRLY